MAGKIVLSLLILIIIVFPSTIFCQESEAKAEGNATSRQSPDEKTKGNSSDILDGEKCDDAHQEDEEKFLMTRIGGDHGCMLIDESDIPEKDKGNRTYGESCTNDRHGQRCKRYVVLIDPINKTKCLKPTHLRCDPAKHVCKCADKGIFVSDIRFQFGPSDPSQNKSQARCLIRPTFDVLPGFDCSPTSHVTSISVDKDNEPTSVCACSKDSEMDKFDTSDDNWWKCDVDTSNSSKGNSLVGRNALVIFALIGVLWTKYVDFLHGCR